MPVAYAVVTLLLGVAALWAGVRVAGQMQRRRAWPTATGTVRFRRLAVARQLRGRQFAPCVTYDYEVRGRTYRNDQVYAIAGTSASARRMMRVVEALPSTVSVHYDPDDPAQSYLLPNSRATPWIIGSIGGLTVLLGAAQLLTAWRSSP